MEGAVLLGFPDGIPASVTCRLSPKETTVGAVRGDGVRRWSQSGDTLTVWLDGTVAGERAGSTPVQVLGYLPSRDEIPSVLVLGATTVRQAVVRMVPEPGLTVAPGNLRGLRSVTAAEPELVFVAERPDYEGTYEVRAGAAGASVRTLTVAEVRDRKLAFHSTVELSVRRGDLRAATIQLRNWDGEDVKLEAEKASVVQRRTAAGRTWTLELPPRASGRVQITVSGSMPVEEAATGVALPQVSVPGASPAESYVAVLGADIATEGVEGLTAVDSPAAALADWPADANQLRLVGGQAWKVARDDWTMRLRPRGGAGAGPVVVFLADQTVALADGRHWLHEAVYWVRHGPNTDLNVILPKPGSVVAVSVDGVDVAPLQPERRRLWLPLPGRPGVRAVRVRWRYDDAVDQLERPLLQMPVVEGATGGSAVWTVYVPGGFEPSTRDLRSPQPGPARAAAAALYRAVAQLRVSEALLEAAREPGSSPLATAQQRFYTYCRQAEQMLQAEDDDDGQLSPTGESLQVWLRDLREQNRRLAREHKIEEVRADAERRADDASSAVRLVSEQVESGALTDPGAARFRGPLPDTGTPAYVATPEAGAVPGLLIQPVQQRLSRETVGSSAAWLALMLVAAAVALFPRLRSRARPVLPECLLALGVFVWYRTGLTPAVCALLFLAVLGRLALLVGGLRELLQRRPASPQPPGSSVVPASGS
jgi:hypothetical protein